MKHFHYLPRRYCFIADPKLGQRIAARRFSCGCGGVAEVNAVGHGKCSIDGIESLEEI